MKKLIMLLLTISLISCGGGSANSPKSPEHINNRYFDLSTGEPYDIEVVGDQLHLNKSSTALKCAPILSQNCHQILNCMKPLQGQVDSIFNGINAIGIETVCGKNTTATLYLTVGGTKLLETR